MPIILNFRPLHTGEEQAHVTKIPQLPRRGEGVDIDISLDYYEIVTKSSCKKYLLNLSRTVVSMESRGQSVTA